MFWMSKPELASRLIAALEFNANKNPGARSNKLILMTPAGTITCSDAEIRTTQEGTGELLDLALSIEISEEVTEVVDGNSTKEAFLYCVDAEIATYNGSTLCVPKIAIALDSVFGFTMGSMDRP